MSITAGWLILAVILTRRILKKAPKWISCLLWGLVALRLICPFSFESVLSLIPSSETIPVNIAQQEKPVIDSGISIINETVNPLITETFTPSPAASVNPLQTLIHVASMIWIAGVVAMLAYALVSYWKLKKTVSASIPVEEGILACDEVKTPFILGVFRPLIYVPSSMSGETLEHVIRHEKAHLARHDHWWKPLGYLLLSVYWFHPLCWVAYILLCRDIEMACDEKVIRGMNRNDIAGYSQALLDCSFHRKQIAACPLAFGEVGVKERVKGVLNYKKPAFWIMLVAVVSCIVLAVCLMTDPFSNRSLSGKLRVSMDMAVAEHNRSSHSEGHFIATDYDVLLVSESGNETTVYAWVLYEEYSFDGRDVKVETGSHIPTAITFDTSANNNDSSTYDVIEYWEPRDGSYYADDIRAKFPWSIRGKALDATKSKAKSENCLRAAREYYGVSDVNGEPDLSFLNYKNAMSLVADVIDVGTFYYPPAGEEESGSVIRGYVDGNALARYLDLVSWKQADAPKEDLLSPESIQFCIEDNYRITLYKEAQIAIVKFGYDARFYQIQSDDYNKAVEMFYTEPKDTSSQIEKTADLESLRAKYPEYFDLSTFKGLEVYVWQMAPDSYSCGVLAGTNREKTLEELMKLKGASIAEMQVILSTYDIAVENISIIPWQNPVSSYIAGYWVSQKDEDPAVVEKRRQEYIDGIRQMLFGSPLQPEVKTYVAYANWAEGGMMRDCLNGEKMIISSVHHLPVYRLDTLNDLNGFRERYQDVLTPNHGWNEVPSFNEIASSYDDSFFDEHALILAYVEAGSGSFRYAIQNVSWDGSALCLDVIQTNHPEAYTDDMAGWFVIAEVSDSDIAGVTEFDARLLANE